MLSVGYTEFQVPVGHFRLREGQIWHPVETISELNHISHFANQPPPSLKATIISI